MNKLTCRFIQCTLCTLFHFVFAIVNGNHISYEIPGAILLIISRSNRRLDENSSEPVYTLQPCDSSENGEVTKTLVTKVMQRAIGACVQQGHLTQDQAANYLCSGIPLNHANYNNALNFQHRILNVIIVSSTHRYVNDFPNVMDDRRQSNRRRNQFNFKSHLHKPTGATT